MALALKCPILVSSGGTDLPHSLNSLRMTILRNIETGKVHLSLVCDPEFLDAIEGLQSFVLDNNADCDMAYDWGMRDGKLLLLC